MKKFQSICLPALMEIFLLFSATQLHTQNVGIGISTPDVRLHVVAAAQALLKLENNTDLAAGVSSDIYFKTGMFYTGALKTIGTGSSYARLGLFTYSSTTLPGLKERVSILDEGKVGIGTTAPDYQLHIVYPAAQLMKLENTSDLAIGTRIALDFKTGTKYTGSIQTTGTSQANARLGFFTLASVSESGLLERLSIADNGNVGIGTIQPNAKLDILGGSWDLNTTEGDLRVGNTMYRLLAGVAIDGGGAGDVYLQAQGGTNRMFLGTAQQNIITIYKAKLGIGAGFAGIPDAVLHIKQANEWGLSMENYLNTDKWTLGILGGGDLYLSFNHSLLGNFNKSTGEYSYISDVKLKTEVRYVNAIWLDKLMQLRPATYLMKSQEAESTGRHLGFIAQDVQEVFPEAVFENERGLLMLNYDKLEVLAIKAIQEQQEAINELKKQNEQMKGEIEALKHSGHSAGNK